LKETTQDKGTRFNECGITFGIKQQLTLPKQDTGLTFTFGSCTVAPFTDVSFAVAMQSCAFHKTGSTIVQPENLQNIKFKH
jgi:hypothetical protein